MIFAHQGLGDALRHRVRAAAPVVQLRQWTHVAIAPPREILGDRADEDGAQVEALADRVGPRLVRNRHRIAPDELHPLGRIYIHALLL